MPPRKLGAMRIGAHVDPDTPLAAAAARQADVVQFFLADPQGWKSPQARADADELRAADIDVYIHAPYVINVATLNNRIRIPSRKLLVTHAEAAAAVGARALIVHGGHVGKGEDVAVGCDNWRKTFKYAAELGGFRTPVLIENTAGGDNAMTRYLDRIGRVWDAISTAEGFDQVGFCLDTCHAHAGGNDLSTIVEDVRKITGRIDLVHANDSRDAFDSGADRHTNFGAGKIDPDALAGVVRAAGTPVVCETPGGPDQHKADFAWLRERV